MSAIAIPRRGRWLAALLGWAAGVGFGSLLDLSRMAEFAAPWLRGFVTLFLEGFVC